MHTLYICCDVTPYRRRYWIFGLNNESASGERRSGVAWTNLRALYFTFFHV